MDAKIFGYCINLNERGMFYADVRSEDGSTLFEVRSSEDEADSDLVQDGFMSNWRDIFGLQVYLIDLGILENGSRIQMLVDAEIAWSEQEAQDEEEDETIGLAEGCRP